MKIKYFLLTLIFFAQSLFCKTMNVHDVIEIGLKNSYDINTQKFSLKISQQGLYSAFLDLLPSAEYSISRTETTTGNITNSGSISISETISSNDSRFFSIRRNLSSLKKSKIDLQISKREYIYKVIQQYLNMLQKKKSLEITKQEINLSKMNLDETNILFNNGKVSNLEVQQANISYSQSLIDSLKAQNELENSIRDLCFIINIPHKTSYEFDTLTYEFRNNDSYNFNEDNNLTIASIKENVFQSKLDYIQNSLNFIPRLSFSLSKSLNWNEKNLFDFDENYTPMQYSVTLSYSLLNPLKNIPSFSRSRYQLKQNKLYLANIKNEKNKNFNYYLSSFLQSQKSLELSIEQEKLTESYFKLVNEKYKLGMIDLTELEKSRKELIQSKNNRYNEYYNLILLQEKLNLITNKMLLDIY